jgi:molybdate transport system ATP-binding protein
MTLLRFDCSLLQPDFRFDVLFEAGPGVLALFGPSGSGKSTVIRLLAGLERPDKGRIAVGDAVLVDTAKGLFVPPHRRRVGLVFQDARLLPHYSVSGNLTYGRWFTPRPERRIAFEPVVETLGITHLLDRRPSTLSGGERQRVAIGRALLASPRLLLMDEPLASLDQERKLEVLPFIERLRDEFAIPIVYVSHSVEEVARLATSVVRLEHGHVAAQGPPAEVLGAAGGDRFDALSLLTARVERELPEFGVTVLTHPSGRIVIPGRIPAAMGEVRVAIRATSVSLATGEPGPMSIRTVLSGTIAHIEAEGAALARIAVTLKGGETLVAYATRLAVHDLGLAPGLAVRALVKAVAIDERGVAGLNARS